MNTPSLIAGILFLVGIVTGAVAILEPVLGLLSIIRAYVRKLLTGRAVKQPLELDGHKAGVTTPKEPPMV